MTIMARADEEEEDVFSSGSLYLTRRHGKSARMILCYYRGKPRPFRLLVRPCDDDIILFTRRAETTDDNNSKIAIAILPVIVQNITLRVIKPPGFTVYNNIYLLYTLRLI